MNDPHRAAAAAFWLLFLLTAAPAAAQQFQALGEVATSPQFARNVNVSSDGNTVVGFTTGLNGAQSEAFRWRDGTFETLGFLRDDLKASNAVNASSDGAVIVGSSQNGGPDLGGFPSYGGVVWQDGNMTELARPAGLTGGSVNAVSDDGTTLVATAVKYDLFEGYERQVYFYSGGTISPIAMPVGLPYGYAVDISPDGQSATGATSLGFAEPQTGWYYDGGSLVTLAEPVGYRQAIPAAMSPDKIVGSGISESDNIYAPVLWNTPGIPVVLAAPAAQGGRAYGISDDGFVVVGELINSFTAGDNRAHVWNLEQSPVPRALKDILEDLGDDMTGWTLHAATGVSRDGRIVVGYGTDPVGKVQAFRADIGRSFVQFTAPAADEIVEPGETYDVRFTTEDGVSAADIYLVRTTDPAGPRTLLASDVPLADGVWAWDVSPELRSPSTFLVAVSADNVNLEARTSRFRIREKWELNRVEGTTTEPEYRSISAANLFNFDQSDEALWPRSYWDRPTNYYEDLRDGYDPFFEPIGEIRYDVQYFGGKISSEHPTWTSWVRTFGDRASYTSTQPFTFGLLDFSPVNTDANALWGAATGQRFLEPGAGYGGICYGLAAAVLAAFGQERDFFGRWLPGRTIEPLNQLQPVHDVLDALHALFNYQYSKDQLDATIARRTTDITPRQTLQEIKDMFERDLRDQDSFLMIFSPYQIDGVTRRGGHALVPLRMERNDAGLHVIDVYDPNYADDIVQLTVDSTNNSWSHSDPTWLGATRTGLYMSTEVDQVLAHANASWTSIFADGRPAARITSADTPETSTIETGVSSSNLHRVWIGGGNSAVRNSTGEVSYRDGMLLETMPGGFAEFPVTGRPSQPFAYNVPTGDFTVRVTSDETGRSSAWLKSDRAGFRFQREWFGEGSQDSLIFANSVADGAPRQITIVPADSGYISVGSHLSAGHGDNVRLRHMTLLDVLVAPDSQLSLETADDSTAIMVSASTSASYNLSVGESGAAASKRFYHPQVALAAGAQHTIRPSWSGGLDSVTVDIDRDGDGTIDETLVLSDEGLPVSTEESDGGDLARSDVDTGLELDIYPNPARDATTVRVQRRAETGPITIEVFDLLGRRIQVVREWPTGGRTVDVQLATGGLPAGTYFIKADNGGHVAAGQLLVVR